MYTDYARWPDLVFLNAFAKFSKSFMRESDDHAEEAWLDTEDFHYYRPHHPTVTL